MVKRFPETHDNRFMPRAKGRHLMGHEERIAELGSSRVRGLAEVMFGMKVARGSGWVPEA